ncbi:interferon-induced very large GTPase 1-like [Brachyhypopomus gauderio]|uniref:interferon-induced very large GTPase 1-like n=1 Tax=Brachyhypopomus gauderio TaxID=698409 RepID=UPI004040F1BE
MTTNWTQTESCSSGSFNNMGDQMPDLTIVLFGNTSAVLFGDQNILLGQEPAPLEKEDFSLTAPKSRMVSGRNISVINILGLQEDELYLDTVDKTTGQLVKENEIHAFIFILCQLTDADKLGLEWLQSSFGEGVLPYVMILFTYEREEDRDTIIDDLKNNSVLEELLKKCGDRYHTCSKSMNNQSEMRTLLEKIDHLVSENNPHCYTAEMYHASLKSRKDRQDNTRGKKDHGSHLQKDEVDIPHIGQEPSKGGQNTLPEDGLKCAEKEKLNLANTEELFFRLDLREKYKQKRKTSDILEITTLSVCGLTPCMERNIAETFVQRILMMDYKARHIITEKTVSHVNRPIKHEQESDGFDFISKKSTSSERKNNKKHRTHPMDVQMAVLHCSDSFLKQLIVTKLSQCQYALPLLVPDPFTREIEFPLWTFRQIKKSWKTMDTTGKKTTLTKPVYSAETPMVAFFRLGSVSSSKSQLMNSLINEKHNTFFHRHCPGSSRTRLLTDGVVEIAWYLPSGSETDNFPDCVAFCNLHGDAETYKDQLEILTEMSSVNVALLSDQGNSTYMMVLEKLFKGPKSLICLLAEDDSDVSVTKTGKYIIGLKDRNQSDVSTDLSESIKECLSESSPVFKLEDLCKNQVLRIDENQPDCQKGKNYAMEVMRLLDGNEVYKLKENHLPCQGKLWHDWCEMNKDLYRLQGDKLEMQKSKKQMEMKRIREQQHNYGLSGLMKQFIITLKSLEGNEKSYFLKWIGIFLDNCTSEDLSALHHEYDEKWTKVLALKKKHDKSDKMTQSQTQLEEISNKMSASTFGLEHIFREMGQIYEAIISVQTGKTGCKYKEFYILPRLAAELIKNGLPLELMDGDAAHVPQVWVSAVLDELIKILGDQRVFVLSVLGIQSSGKSTMLNAMFGLQFAVSAGRCTRGAFMQLVKVSEEMKAKLKFDYILVVDTEGLRAGKAKIRHDNELATFIIGLGNMTLVNIFGENPAEIKDILQIVVQAVLRMKKVRLNPSCMFVHQNVSEITAREKTAEERKCLEDQLDEMTKVAAKEEDSEAECFSDVITFNVQKDVKYFAQLWEGSPPMAPPNPCYSRNVQELKQNILSKMSTKCVWRLSQFKSHISNLWNALLNENFVFSFRNTLEVAAYRKLEHEYSKWTWSLRSTMMALENKLHYRVINEKSLKVEKNYIVLQMKETKKEVDESVNHFFSEDHDKDILIQWHDRFERKIEDLYEELVKEAKRKLDEVAQLKIAREKIDREKSNNENELFKLSKELAYSMKNKGMDEDDLKNKFEDVWSKWVMNLTQNTPLLEDINIWPDVICAMSESFELHLVRERQDQDMYKKIDIIRNYIDYIILSKHEEICQENPQSTEEQEDENISPDVVDYTVTENIIKETKQEIQRKPIEEQGYNHIYILEIIASIKTKVKEHESKISKYKLKKEFTVDLCLYLCDFAAEQFTELHKKFKEANDVKEYLEKQKPQYLKVFKNYCSGATSTAVFAQFIVQKLEPSILQAAYDQTAIDLTEKMKREVPAFSGNRSNLEKHILTSLAEEENFENYIEYIHKPKEHFNHFITKEVNNFIKKCPEVTETLKKNISSKGECVMAAVNEATVEDCGGNVDTWLQHLSIKLKDELQFKEQECVDQKEITDLGFLQEVVKNGLKDITSKLSCSVSDLNLEMFRKKPDQILIEHLCRCCWEQCPFCNAVCTNTMEDHTGDHMVRFHRNCGINGWSFKFSNNIGIDFCTTAVSSDLLFRTSAGVFSFKEYRKAGGEHARWNITPDNSEMPYWKWFVCRFQKELENYYKKQFTGHGEIPTEWRKFTKEEAIKSLNEL